MQPIPPTRRGFASIATTIVLAGLLVTLTGRSTSLGAVRARTLKDAALIDAPARSTAGAAFSCRLSEEGTVRCWGANDSGQLGDGTTTPRSVPAPVSGISNAVAVAAGTRHACALLADGRVLCWGNNSFGQLGDATNFVRTAPVPVLNISNAVGLAAAGSHSCALTSLGAVRCWGANASGQLGDGSTANRFAPVAVVNLSGPAVALTAGSGHTCALLGDGSAQCWGLNSRGQLGNGTTSTRLTATAVPGLFDIVALAAGSAHTCALVAGGNVKCWGANSSGQIGNGTRIDATSPVLVGGLFRSPVAIAAGGLFSCAVLGQGNVVCWGDNASGQIGDGTATMRLTPAFVNGIERAVTVAAGDRHACAVLADGSASCWGLGGSGQLGNGASSTSFVPVTVAGGGGTFTASAIAAGRRHVCALRANGTVSCWGDNARGQLGDGTTTPRLVPTAVAGLTIPAVAIAAGEAHTCALLIDGSARCWGDNDHGQLGSGVGGGGDFRTSPVQVVLVPPNSLPPAPIVSIVAGDTHTCALLDDGRVRCWGSNASGQIGDSTTVDRFMPLAVPGLGDSARTFGVQAIAAGGSHTCALLTNGSARCWGGNVHGEVGNGSTIDQPSPAGVVGITDGVAIAAGAEHSCVLLAGGSAKCWGSNASGQIGNASSPNPLTPVTVVMTGLSSGPNAFTGIAAGRDHSCAIQASGNALCWGDNTSGEIGDGTATSRSNPVQVTIQAFLGSRTGPKITVVSPFANVVQIAAGDRDTCAIVAGGAVRCWGDGTLGQLGLGVSTTQFRPASVPSFTVNIVPTVALDEARAAIVTIVAACEEGRRLELSVSLSQDDADGEGRAVVECTGAIERYPVIARARGRASFLDGPAEARATAFVRERGVVVESQEWSRRVELSLGR